MQAISVDFTKNKREGKLLCPKDREYATLTACMGKPRVNGDEGTKACNHYQGFGLGYIYCSYEEEKSDETKGS